MKKIILLICLICLFACQSKQENTFNHSNEKINTIQYNDEVYNTAFSQDESKNIYFTAGYSLYQTNINSTTELIDFSSSHYYPTGYCLLNKNRIYMIMLKVSDDKISKPLSYHLVSTNQKGSDFKELYNFDQNLKNAIINRFHIKNNIFFISTNSKFYTFEIDYNNNKVINFQEIYNDVLSNEQAEYINQYTNSITNLKNNLSLNHIHSDYLYEIKLNENRIYQTNLHTQESTYIDIGYFNHIKLFNTNFNLIDNHWFCNSAKEGVVMLDIDFSNPKILLSEKNKQIKLY